jgi:hypothetical protein
LQAKPHWPPAQVALPRVTCGHGLLQPPQWAVAVIVSTQLSPHLFGLGAVQSDTQLYALALALALAHSGADAPQLVSQLPQRAALAMLASQPSSGFWLQCA